VTCREGSSVKARNHCQGKRAR